MATLARPDCGAVADPARRESEAGASPAESAPAGSAGAGAPPPPETQRLDVDWIEDHCL